MIEPSSTSSSLYFLDLHSCTFTQFLQVAFIGVLRLLLWSVQIAYPSAREDRG
jgi:hypothetical protein